MQISIKLICLSLLLTFVLEAHSKNLRKHHDVTATTTAASNDYDTDIDNEISPSESSYLSQTLSDLSALVRTILNTFSSSPIRDDTLILLHKTIDKLTDSLEVFGEKMLNATESVAKQIFISLKEKLSNIELDSKDLSRLTDEKFERVIKYVNETMMEQSLSMELWASNIKRQLREMNDTAVARKLCPVIDALIKETTDELSGCCNIVIKPVRSICRSVKSILRETFQVVADVVDTVDSCLFNEKKIDSMVISCVGDIYDEVSALTDRATALRDALVTKLPNKIMLSNFCISMVSVSMAPRKTNVEEQIAYLNN